MSRQKAGTIFGPNLGQKTPNFGQSQTQEVVIAYHWMKLECATSDKTVWENAHMWPELT